MLDDITFTLQTLAGVASLYALTSLIHFSLLSLPPQNFPPGPPTLPFIGNVHHFTSAKLHVKFTAWRKTYGDIVGLKAGPTNIVVLNSAKVAHELLEKRGSIDSGRPTDYIFREHIVHGTQHILFLQNDAYLKRWRSAVRHLVGPTGSSQALPLQNAAAAFFAYNLMAAPQGLQNRLQNWALGTPLSAICGHGGAQKDAHLVRQVYDNQRTWLALLNPGEAPPVALFPLLKYVPPFLAPWKRRASHLRANQGGFYYMMLNAARDELRRAEVGDNHRPGGFLSLMARLLQEQGDRGGFDDHQLVYLGGGLLDAAVDTTYLSVLTFIKILGAYPDVLKRAQVEVDSVSGTSRPPGAEDLENLHYLKACFFETLRFRPVAPVNLPHTLSADDTFRGYRIPKDTVVLQNIWIDSHDPSLFRSPSSVPSRAPPHQPIRTAHPHPWKRVHPPAEKTCYAFGSGRRQCPGNVFAQNGFLAWVAKMVRGFDVRAKGEVDLSVETGFHGGLLLGAEPFEVEFVARSEERRRAVVGEWEGVRAWLD